MTKAQKARQAAMHQRIRDRLPHLSRLVDAAEHHRHDMATFLETASQTPIDEVFEHGSIQYRRLPRYSAARSSRHTEHLPYSSQGSTPARK